MVDPIVKWAEGKGRRIQVLVELLSLYNDLVDPTFALDGIAASGERVIQMPATYTASVRELERLLKLMRDDRHEPLVVVAGRKVSVRSLHWHVMEQFVRCTTRNTWVDVPAKTRSGKRTTKRQRAIVTVRSDRVDPKLVSAAVEWIAERWSLPSEPMLPKAVVEARRQVAGLERVAA